jgi:RimJ/RimL family protein N-acetyltransferase
MTILTTSRLSLRPISIDDLDAKFAIGQHPDVYRFDGFVLLESGEKRPRTREETRIKLEQRVAEFALQGFGQWAMVLQETGGFIGWAGLQFYLLDAEVSSTPEIELFYGLSRGHWGQGFATEACHALIQYGFTTLRLRRITSVAARENVHSVNVMRRVGMRIEDHPSESEHALGILDNPRI